MPIRGPTSRSGEPQETRRPTITSGQRNAIERYLRLVRHFPSLFHQRQGRPLILDRASIEHHAATTGDHVGVLAETAYHLFIVDLVESRPADGPPLRFGYQRLINVRQLRGAIGVVVIGVVEDSSVGTIGDIALVRQERHATGQSHLELPRGFGEDGVDAAQHAVRELREETGFIGTNPNPLGETLVDSGMTDTRVRFYSLDIIDQTVTDQERTEAISAVQLVSRSDLAAMIADGRIEDGFTVQAYGLLAVR